jgi:hypothetical protein
MHQDGAIASGRILELDFVLEHCVKVGGEWTTIWYSQSSTPQDWQQETPYTGLRTDLHMRIRTQLVVGRTKPAALLTREDLMG